MKCKLCGSEIKENWVKFPKLGIEVNFTQEQNNKTLKEIKIPKGQRLLKYEELPEIMDYIIKNKLDIWSYFKQPLKNTKNVARFGADSNWAGLVCNGDSSDSYPLLGVIFCRNIIK